MYYPIVVMNMFVSWVGTPYFFHVGRIIFLYIGDDQRTIQLWKKPSVHK